MLIKHFRRYDWLSLPHDIEAAPNEAVARTSPTSQLAPYVL